MLSEKEKQAYMEQFKLLLDDVSSHFDEREFFIVDVNIPENTWTSVLCMSGRKDIVEVLKEIVDKTYQTAMEQDFDRDKLDKNNEEILFNRIKKNVN